MDMDTDFATDFTPATAPLPAPLDLDDPPLDEGPQPAPGSAEAAPAPGDRPDRKRLEEQLSALKRKELELRRAIAIADHPELAEAIRCLEGRAFALSRVETKIAQGLSKAEDRRKEALEKKLATLRDKRAELDAQVAELDLELDTLVRERERALLAEQRAALHDLVLTMGEHAAALAAAGLDAGELVPEIAQHMPQIRALAEELVAGRGSSA
jgi:chromosome segregation ATPase